MLMLCSDSKGGEYAAALTARANSIDVLLALHAAGIYRGYTATLYSFGPFSAFYFGFYEQSKSAAVRRNLN